MIKLKTLLEQSGWSNSPEAPIYWIKKHAPSIAIKLGEQIDKELGGGANGVAFLLKSGKVLKITGDNREAAAASRYRTKQNVPHIVSVYDVRKLEGDIVDPNDPTLDTIIRNMIESADQHYVIVMDYVTPFNDNEQRVWREISDDYLSPRFSDEITREELESFIDEHQNLTLPERWIDTMITQRQSVLAAFRRNSVYTLEAHGENMGWNRQGQLVHFDWWMRLDSDHDLIQQFETHPRRLNKSIKYDASGIDTPNDPSM
jgi:hypothetical protein